MDTQSTTEIQALITLLEDPDPEVFEHVSGKLSEMGAGVIPTLESAWQRSPDATFQERVENLIHQIQVRETLAEFEVWLKKPYQDLLEGLAIISRYRFSDLDPAHIYRKAESIKRDIWIELNDNLTPLEATRVFNLVFFRWHGFKRIEGENPPGDYFVNQVLESKKGAPMALAVLYLAIAQRLELPLFGINLPRYFVLAYTHVELDEDAVVKPQLVKHVMFYINPVNNGMIFSKAEIDDYLRKLDVEAEPTFYEPVGNSAVMRLYLEMLQEAYVDHKELEHSSEISLFLDLMTRLGC